MAELNESMKALVGSYTDWDATYGRDVDVIGEGLIYATVCTALDDATTDAAMASRPAGTRHGWSRSTDATFATGETNPRPCEQQTATRRHVLYEA